ncbi:MAG: hypothetical protein Q9174_001291 [Haloplaca sp. 1 TL-2023]
MGSGKKSRITTSKVSAAAAPSGQSLGKNRSSIIRSSFAPSLLQVALFASVIQGFDSQRIRIHDTTTGRLQCEYAIAPKATVNCLDWGFYGGDASAYEEQREKASRKKKRKRTEQVNGTTATSDGSDVVLAFGTSESEVHFYSPATAKVVGVLGSGHTQGIRDFRFDQSTRGKQSIGWTIGGDGRLVRWDLRKGEMISSTKLPDQSTRTLCSLGPAILCASHKAFIIDAKQLEPLQTITASSNMVHSVVASSDNSHYLTAAETDRYIRVFDRGADSSIGELVAESEVLKVATTSPMSQQRSSAETVTDRALAAINKDGVLELFDSPFSFQTTGSLLNSQSLKARIRQRTRKARAQVRVTAPDEKSAVVPLLDVAFQDHDLIFVYAEGGVDPIFDRIRWRTSESTEVVLEGVVELARTKGAGALGAVVMDGVKDLGKLQVSESQTVVTTGEESQPTRPGIRENDAISISSAEEDIDDYEDDEEELPNGNIKSFSGDEDAPSESHHQEARAKERQPEGGVGLQDDLVSTVAAQEPTQTEGSDIAMEDAAEEIEDPSFGDMIRAVAPGVVDVQAAMTSQQTSAVVPTSEKQLDLPSGMSLGTVLTQSLRTNDVKLLESCLHVKQIGIVRATIERLDSALASTLIRKLSERFHSRPGRAGSLLVWIQWTVVAHGGYLASQPSAMKTLAGLHKVVGERARSLPLLLSLKGKLDMLEAQMNLRASMRARSKTANLVDDEDEEDVIYVEGQEEDTDDSDAENLQIEPASSSVPNGGQGDTESEEEADEEMPMTNGAVAESFDQGSDSDDDEEGLIDDEAESTEGESDGDGPLDEVDHEDVDSDESDVSMVEIPPAKRLATARLSNGIPGK